MSQNTLADLLKKAIDVEIAAKVHTMLPGKITSYDASKQKAQVQPLIKKSYLDGTSTSMPIIVNVPVIFPRSGGASLTFPVNVGDTVALVFAERALERWLSLGGEVEPGASRKFSISDCVAIPGLFAFNENSLGTANDVVLRYNSAQVTLNNDSKLAIGNSSEELISLVQELATVVKNLKVGNSEPGLPVLASYQPTVQDIIDRLDSIKGSLV